MVLPPRKDKNKAKAIDKGKGKVVDKGNDKVVEPERPDFIPLQTGGPLRIRVKSKRLEPQSPKNTKTFKEPLALKKIHVDTPPRVARILRLLDESKELEAQQPQSRN
jgi:hypothetical protein